MLLKCKNNVTYQFYNTETFLSYFLYLLSEAISYKTSELGPCYVLHGFVVILVIDSLQR